MHALVHTEEGLDDERGIENGSVICDMREAPGAEQNANARLIAAAPDLLAAAEAMCEQLTKLDGFPDLTSPYSGARVALKAAIAKARGEE